MRSLLKVFIGDGEIALFEFNGKPVDATNLPAQAKHGISAFTLLCIATAHLSSTQNDKNRMIAWKNIPEPLRLTLRDAFRRPGKWLTSIFDTPAEDISRYVGFIGENGSYFQDNIDIQIYCDSNIISSPESLRELKIKFKSEIELYLTRNEKRALPVLLGLNVHRTDNTHFSINHLASRERLDPKDLVVINIFHPVFRFFNVFWIDSLNFTWSLHPEIDEDLGVSPGCILYREAGWSLRIPDSGMLPEIKSNSGHETCLAILSNHQVGTVAGKSLRSMIQDIVTSDRHCHQSLPTSSFRRYSSDPSKDSKESKVVLKGDFGRPSPLTSWEEKLFSAFSKAMNGQNIAFDMCFQNIPVGDP